MCETVLGVSSESGACVNVAWARTHACTQALRLLLRCLGCGFDN